MMKKRNSPWTFLAVLDHRRDAVREHASLMHERRTAASLSTRALPGSMFIFSTTSLEAFAVVCRLTSYRAFGVDQH